MRPVWKLPISGEQNTSTRDRAMFIALATTESLMEPPGLCRQAARMSQIVKMQAMFAVMLPIRPWRGLKPVYCRDKAR